MGFGCSGGAHRVPGLSTFCSFCLAVTSFEAMGWSRLVGLGVGVAGVEIWRTQAKRAKKGFKTWDMTDSFLIKQFLEFYSWKRCGVYKIS